MVILKIENLTREYVLKGEIIKAINNISLDIYNEEFLVIMGPSGSGKSTFIHLLAGLDTQASGSITYEGVNILKAKRRFLTKYRQRVVGIVFQIFYLIERSTARYNIRLPQLLSPFKSKESFDINSYIKEIELESQMDAPVDILSTGQQQRVAIARALVNNPEIILADEPTGNLDSENSLKIIEILKKLNTEKHKTIVLVTHNEDFKKYADRIVYLKDGAIENIETIHDKSTENEQQPESSEHKRSGFGSKFSIAAHNIISNFSKYITVTVIMTIALASFISLILIIEVIATNALNNYSPVDFANTMYVNPHQSANSSATILPITASTMNQIENINGTSNVYPIKYLYGSVQFNSTKSSVFVQNASPVEDIKNSEETVGYGRFFTNNKENSIILSYPAAQNLTNSPQSLIGQYLKFNLSTSITPTKSNTISGFVKVIGILDSGVKYPISLVSFKK